MEGWGLWLVLVLVSLSYGKHFTLQILAFHRRHFFFVVSSLVLSRRDTIDKVGALVGTSLSSSLSYGKHFTLHMLAFHCHHFFFVFSCGFKKRRDR
jgi:hypothetical protein